MKQEAPPSSSYTIDAALPPNGVATVLGTHMQLYAAAMLCKLYGLNRHSKNRTEAEHCRLLCGSVGYGLSQTGRIELTTD